MLIQQVNKQYFNNNNNNNNNNNDVQKIVVLSPCSILRKFRNDEVHFADDENPSSCHFTMFAALYTHFSIP